MKEKRSLQPLDDDTSKQQAKSGEHLRPLARLLPFMRPYKGTILLAVAALLVAAAITLALPVAIRRMIDQGFSAAQTTAIDQYFLALAALAGLLAVFSAVRFYLVSWLGERVVADIRTTVYRHLLTMTPGFFETTRTGEVLARLTTDTTLVQAIAGVNLSIILRSLLTLLGGLVMLAVTSPRLTSVIVLLIPLVLVPLITYGRRIRRLSKDTQARVADTSNVAGETLNAIETVQAFTLETLQDARYAQSVTTSFKTAVRRIRARALLTWIAITLVFGTVVFVLWLGAQAVVAGTMSLGELGQFLLYAMLVAGSAASLSEMWGELQRAAGAVERLTDILHSEPAIVSPKAPATLKTPVLGAIDFAAVNFNYPSRPDERALTDFTLRVEPGETVALVGPSGAGKSTVLKLLLRFYDPNEGTLSLDGIDIRTLHPKQLRTHIGTVAQETVVFAESAYENIRYGRPNATPSEVHTAARNAGAAQFIEALPDGYDTYLGERGARLSGGERQRIAIARALLKNPPVMLLDEATSSLDAQSEQLVQAALATLMSERTTLVVAHRLSTVRSADRIVVINDARIDSVGTHDELMTHGGLYASLARLQFSDARN